MKNESGRSMVEMLGVLAIIGVLSIGGIAGYTLAMRRYKANNIVNAMSMASIYGMTARGGQGISTDDDDKYVKVDASDLDMSSYPTGLKEMSANRDGNVYATFNNDSDDQAICSLVADILGKKAKTTSGSVTTEHFKCTASSGTALSAPTGDASDPSTGNFVWAAFN